jgi:beta-glucanase (GH16 family)
MFLLLLHVSAQAVANSSPAVNCKSGRYDFSKIAYQGTVPDPSLYDFVVDYGVISGPKSNLEVTKGRAKLSLVKNVTSPRSIAQGIRLTHTRIVKYAKITARIKAIRVPGAVTTFITMSPRGDEIDVEFVGKNPSNVESNVFYKGIPERNTHNGNHAVANIGLFHDYTIDWRNDSISWAVDGKVVRVYKNDEKAVSKMTPKGERWFPTEPSQVQIAVWDGLNVGSWAGGPIPWLANQTSISAEYEWIDIQCYNDKNQIVPETTDATKSPKKSSGFRAGIFFCLGFILLT